MNAPTFPVAVSGVVVNDAGLVLLIRTEQAGWELPGGRVEQGEDLGAALVREIQEESCCAAAVERLVGVDTNIGAGGMVLFTFRCIHTGGEPRAGDETLDAGWFRPEEARRLVTHPMESLRLRIGLDDQPGVTYRAYRRAEDAGSGYHILREERW